MKRYSRISEECCVKLCSITVSKEEGLLSGCHSLFPREGVDGTRPVLPDDLNERVRAVDDTRMRTVVGRELEGRCPLALSESV